MFEKLKDAFPHLKDKWEEYSGYYKRIEVPAKTILLLEGQVSRKAFPIERGCLRVWFDHDGRDVTFQFFFENEGVSSIESFRKNIPSPFTIETIEPCVLYWISKKNLDKILKAMNEVAGLRDTLTNIMLERQLHYMRHFLSFIKNTPAQRYSNLMKEHPEIIQRVPQQYIASYLGITPVSLSRIRNRIKK